MKIAVRYHTRSGNTKKLAEAIAGAVGVPACDLSVPLEPDTDILFLGSSLYAFDVDEAVKRFIDHNRENIGTLYNFGTAASPSSTYRVVCRLAGELGVRVAEREFHCPGSFLFLNRGRPNAEDCEAAAAFAREVTAHARRNGAK